MYTDLSAEGPTVADGTDEEKRRPESHAEGAEEAEAAERMDAGWWTADPAGAPHFCPLTFDL